MKYCRKTAAAWFKPLCKTLTTLKTHKTNLVGRRGTPDCVFVRIPLLLAFAAVCLIVRLLLFRLLGVDSNGSVGLKFPYYHFYRLYPQFESTFYLCQLKILRPDEKY